MPCLSRIGSKRRRALSRFVLSAHDRSGSNLFRVLMGVDGC